MEEILLDWEDFILKYNSNEIHTLIDLNKGHALIKTSLNPVKSWRFTVYILSIICTVAIPSAIVLFFFVKWWIPLIIILTVLVLVRAIRNESAKAVIEISLQFPEFYFHAIHSKTLKIYHNK